MSSLRTVEPEHRLGVDRCAGPPASNVVQSHDLKVQVWCVPVRVATMADVSDHVAFPDPVAFVESATVPVQVRIIVNHARPGISGVDGNPAGFVRRESEDFTVIRGQHGRPLRRHEVDCIVDATTPFRAKAVRYLRHDKAVHGHHDATLAQVDDVRRRGGLRGRARLNARRCQRQAHGEEHPKARRQRQSHGAEQPVVRCRQPCLR